VIAGRRRGRPWLARRGALPAVAAVALAGCWGDRVPSLDRIGAQPTGSGEVTILVHPCPDEAVERVELQRTDDDGAEILGLLWSVEAEAAGGSVAAFTVGRTPAGFRQVVALDGPLQPGDHVQAVVTSTRRGPIPMSFAVADLRSDEVLVRPTSRSHADFDARAAAACPA
jgi:hypothetical protein